MPLFEPLRRYTQPPAGLFEEVSGQQPHIVQPFAQGSGVYREHAEAIKKILAKPACFGFLP